MNIVILTGRLTRDTELSNTQGGTGYLRNAIAVKKDYKNKDGEYDTDFYNFCAFGKTAEYLNNYCNKGDLILLKGKLTTSKINDEKQRAITIIELICESVEIQNKKQQENVEHNSQNNVYYNNNNSNNNQNDDSPFKDVKSQFDIDSSDLPF